jgi:1-pyrroline-5-carboxylate dehydrogenase
MSAPFKITYSVLNADMGELHKAFDAALHKVKGDLGREFPSRVVGKDDTGSELITDTNPADTRQVLGKFHAVSAKDADRIVAHSEKAQRHWGALPWHDRVRIMLKTADLISDRRLMLAAVMTLETGKNRWESLGDVEESADLLRYYARQVEEANGFVKPLARLSPNEDTRSVLRPWGVFTVIAPFNFPMALAAGMTSAALLGGNSVILKPSEETPWCGELLYQAFVDAGLPEGVLQLAHGHGRDIGHALCTHEKVAGVAFTGSKAVGMQLLQQAVSGIYPKPCFVEMGGKNAAIITASANLDKAVSGCSRSAFGLSGQKCSALSRIYVHQDVHDEFLDRLIMHTQTLKIGDPGQEQTFMGPVINARAVERYKASAASAKKDGTVHLGGVHMTQEALSHGHFVAPTIVTVPAGHPVEQEELFLPFVTVSSYSTFDEALKRANSTDYGLTAGIFSREDAEVERFMQEMQAGVLYSNRETGATTGAWPGVQAFCGWKGSGASGKGGCGPYYVQQFMREQSQTRHPRV